MEEDNTLKENAAIAVQLFKNMADRREISLKLRQSLENNAERVPVAGSANLQCEKEDNSMEGMKVTKVCTARDKVEAEMILDILGEHNIQAFRQGIASGGLMDIYSGKLASSARIFLQMRAMWKQPEN